MSVTGNAFSDEDGRINGGFFGSEHEEMAGVVDDHVPEVNLLAGFGGTRVGERNVVASGTYAHDNGSAQDLLDHWNDVERLQHALDLSAAKDIDAERDVVGSLLDATGADAIGGGTKLRNVSPEDIEIIGEKNGITFGQWKGGPAGTLNIEFDWRFAEHADLSVRAGMERAGKSWSHRIKDDFGTHRVSAETEIRYGKFRNFLDSDVTTDGLVIFMHLGEDGYRGEYMRADITPDDIEPWLGRTDLPPWHRDHGRIKALQLGHVLGIDGRESNLPYWRYVNTEEHTFEGPEAVRANGGEPVPFRQFTVDPETGRFIDVPPGTPGAKGDYSILAECGSVMAYCWDRPGTTAPGEIDFAILADIGYEILDEATASDPELYGYGAWGQYSAWGAGVERTLGGGDYDHLRAGANAFGIAPESSLADNSVLSGTVTWSGSLLGVDTGDAALPPVFGDAELGVSLKDLTGTARFDNLVVDRDGVSRAFRAPSLSYDVSVTGNAFSDEKGRIRGEFFGPEHEEMAGVVDDRVPEVNLLAGFGGTKVGERNVVASGTYARDNGSAQDLLDHWNDPERLQHALDLSAVKDIDAERDVVGSLLDATGSDAVGGETKLRNVSPEDIMTLGERDGITYGQWKGGPAGTLNIELDWRFAEYVDPSVRARGERAGKSWSRRIRDEFGTHRAAAGTEIRHGKFRNTLDSDVTTNGLVIFMYSYNDADDSDGTSSAGTMRADITPDDFEPWLGTFELAPKGYERSDIHAHEIGHILGFSYREDNLPYLRHVNTEENTFGGPEAVRANGGAPVALQWIVGSRETEDLGWVAPGTEGARHDYSHTGVCISIMAYCHDGTDPSPSEIDFAILADIGYEILDEATASDPELYGYGAWGQYSAWGAGVERTLGGGDHDHLRAGANAFGIAPESSLAENPVLSGTVTWSGSLLGVDTGDAALPPVFGDAELGVSLKDLTGTARFDNLVVDRDGVSDLPCSEPEL